MLLNLPLLYKIVSIIKHEDSFIPEQGLVIQYTVNKDNYDNLLMEIARANGQTEYEPVDILDLDILGVKFQIKPE